MCHNELQDGIMSAFIKDAPVCPLLKAVINSTLKVPLLPLLAYLYYFL